MAKVYRNSGHQATVERQLDRRAVESGRAYWLCSKKKYVVEVSQPTTPPVKHVRKRFGESILPTYPRYRLPVSISDYEWWATEAHREEERELDRRFEEFRAQERLSAGLEPY